MVIEIRVATDAFPWETAWVLTNNCGLGIIRSATQQAEFSTGEMCLPIGEYEFTITDEEGDGICCDYGNGWYDIRVNGSIVHSGGVFGSSETETFGVCPNQPTLQPSENMSTLQPSSLAPLTFEPSSHAPTENPTTSLPPMAGNPTTVGPETPAGSGGAESTLTPTSAAPSIAITSRGPTPTPTITTSSLRPTTATGE